MTTLNIASKIKNTLIEKYDSFANVSSYSNFELATVEVHKLNIHVFNGGLIRIENVQGETLGEYKTVNTVIKKVMELIK